MDTKATPPPITRIRRFVKLTSEELPIKSFVLLAAEMIVEFSTGLSVGTSGLSSSSDLGLLGVEEVELPGFLVLKVEVKSSVKLPFFFALQHTNIWQVN
jgi:hypothetical protein